MGWDGRKMRRREREEKNKEEEERLLTYFLYSSDSDRSRPENMMNGKQVG